MLTPQCWGYRRVPPHSALYVGTEALMGPQAYTAGTSLTKLSPSPNHFRQHTSSWSESTNLQLIYNFLMTHQYNLRPPHLQAGPLKWPSLSPLLGYKQEKVETLWLLCSIFRSVMSTLSSISGCLQSSQELPAPPWGRGTSTSAANAVPACDLSWDFPHSHLCTRKDSAGVSCWER